MNRSVYSFLGALLSLVPIGASAQTGTTAVTTAIQSGLTVKKNGTALKNEPLIYVTRADCVSNAPYEFTVRYGTNVKVVELWVSVGSQDCSSAASRQRASTGASESVCKLVGSNKQSTNPVTIKVNARKLFSTSSGGGLGDDSGIETEDDAGTSDAGTSDAGTSDAGTSDAGTDSGTDAGDDSSDDDGLEPSGCDEVKNQTYTAYFVPLDIATDTSANMAYPPVTSTYSTLTATFTLFTDLPEPPGGLEAKTGESELGVKFTALAGALPKTKYRAFFDWGTGGEECGSGALVEGREAPEAEDTITSVSSTSTTIKLKDLDAKDIPLGSYVAASVVTVDPAGNQSLLGPPICVERVETIGFADRCKEDPDCSLHSCSVRPGARAAGAFGLSALLGLALALFVRRRHV